MKTGKVAPALFAFENKKMTPRLAAIGAEIQLGDDVTKVKLGFDPDGFANLLVCAVDNEVLCLYLLPLLRRSSESAMAENGNIVTPQEKGKNA